MMAFLPVGEKFYKCPDETRHEFIERAHELMRSCDYAEVVQFDYDWDGRVYFQKNREVAI